MAIQFNQLASKVADHVKDGHIYTTEFNDLKQAATRCLEKDLDTWRNAYVYTNDSEAVKELSWAVVGVSIMSFPSKKALKQAEALGQEDSGTNLLELFAKYKPVVEGLKTLKVNVVKGRKPSTGTTPVRTLENTGTCACCGRNVKLNNSGKVVSHGFRRHRGYVWTESCFGTGFDPVEVSPEGIKATVSSLKAILLLDPPTGTRKQLAAYQQRQEAAKQLLPETEKRLTEWVPGTLPG